MGEMEERKKKRMMRWDDDRQWKKRKRMKFLSLGLFIFCLYPAVGDPGPV